MLVPLYGFLEGDTIGLLVLAHDTDTISEVAKKLQSAAFVRVPEQPDVVVMASGQQLADEMTVAAAGLAALDRIDVVAAPTRIAKEPK